MLLEVVQRIRASHPDYGLRKILSEYKRQMPESNLGTKEVRAAIAELDAQVCVLTDAGIIPIHSDLPQSACVSKSAISGKNTCIQCREQSRTDLNLCARCRQVYYCGKSCQKKHWKTHRSQCESMRAGSLVVAKLSPSELANLTRADLAQLTQHGSGERAGSKLQSVEDAYLLRAERLILKGDYRGARTFFERSFMGGYNYMESLVFGKRVQSTYCLGYTTASDDHRVERARIERGEVLDVDRLRALFGGDWEDMDTRCKLFGSPLLGMSKSFQMQYVDTKCDGDLVKAVRYASCALEVMPTFNHTIHLAMLLSGHGTAISDSQAAAHLANTCLQMDVSADPTYNGEQIATVHKLFCYDALAKHATGVGKPEWALQLLTSAVDLDPSNAGSWFNLLGGFPIIILAVHFGEELLEAKLSKLVQDCDAGLMTYGSDYLPHFRHGLQRVQQRHGGYTHNNAYLFQ